MMVSRFLCALLPVAGTIGAVVLVGCAATPPVHEDRPEDALKDPMNYSLNMDNTDITGGGTGNYDDKAMKRDLDDFFNP